MSSEFVAKSDIPFGDPGRGVYAFRKGDRVPADLVENNKWQDYVVGAATKEAGQIRADLTGDTFDSKTAAGSTAPKSIEQRG